MNIESQHLTANKSSSVTSNRILSSKDVAPMLTKFATLSLAMHTQHLLILNFNSNFTFTLQHLVCHGLACAATSNK